jgi:hypothetical protein
VNDTHACYTKTPPVPPLQDHPQAPLPPGPVSRTSSTEGSERCGPGPGPGSEGDSVPPSVWIREDSASVSDDIKYTSCDPPPAAMADFQRPPQESAPPGSPQAAAPSAVKTEVRGPGPSS